MIMENICTLNNGKGIVLADQDNRNVSRRIFNMLKMTCDCGYVNKLVDDEECTETSLKEVDWPTLESVQKGYIVYIGNHNSLTGEILNLDMIVPDNYITVYVADPEEVSATTLNVFNGEVTLLAGTVEGFLKHSEDYILAW
jgi:hypothetical protein